MKQAVSVQLEDWMHEWCKSQDMPMARLIRDSIAMRILFPDMLIAEDTDIQYEARKKCEE